MSKPKNKTKSTTPTETNSNRTANKYRKRGTRRNKSKTRKTKEKIFKGGNNPFSNIFGMWGTMTYNLSNAFSVFTITPPTGYLNQSQSVSNPSPSKQFV